MRAEYSFMDSSYLDAVIMLRMKTFRCLGLVTVHKNKLSAENTCTGNHFHYRKLLPLRISSVPDFPVEHVCSCIDQDANQGIVSRFPTARKFADAET